MWLFRKRNNEKIQRRVLKKEQATRSILLVVGCFISALSFNLFFVPNNFISGGFGGIGIVLNKLCGIDVSTVILMANLICITVSFFTLGFKDSLMSAVGALIYTLFLYATEGIPHLINFSFDNILLYVLAAGVCGGFGESLVYKAGFNTGGNSILALIIQKYKKMPLGKILRCIAFIIIGIGGIVFGYTSIMYGIIISFISTYIVDKVLIGISDSKMFYIQTSKEEEVVAFILDIIESGVTELYSKGAYSSKRQKILMCVVPTEKYSFLKSAIKEIDNSAFIVVSDCYEVLGGTKKEKIVF